MKLRRALALIVAAVAVAGGCRFDRAERWLDVVDEPVDAKCAVGAFRCSNRLERCVASDDGTTWSLVADCAAQGQTCDAGLGQCTSCQPNSTLCNGHDVVSCDANGQIVAQAVETCDDAQGLACRSGGCVDLCAQAAQNRSNVGCEYWGVDLDNAMISPTQNAAAQQYAIVISNPEPDLTATVTITQDDGLNDEPVNETVVATAKVSPMNLVVFKLGPREVDGSPPGQFNTGTGTALTRQAYRVKSSIPVVAFQFNPLDNVNVFSNDASLLKPTSALVSDGTEVGPAYVAVGWPQTIATTDDPETNFDTDLRAFLTLVGTTEDTHVTVHTTAKVIPGGPVALTMPGGTITATLGPFQVLNLETGAFNADFTGTTIDADNPVVVFSGSEASDSPPFTNLRLRRCCADHLEQQLDPVRTAGRAFVAAHGPQRTRAVEEAGAVLGVVDEPDMFRVVATVANTTVKTTAPAPDDTFVLADVGDDRTIVALHDFELTSDQPVAVGNVSPSQEAAGIARGLPGGDPSLMIVPPTEQYRQSYVFLTPDKYAFDFVTIVATTTTSVQLDGQPLPSSCLQTTTPSHVIFTCQLSFPVIDPTKVAPNNIQPGVQNDGVHTVSADQPVGVLVSGFDNFVSYGYPAGTDLRDLRLH